MQESNRIILETVKDMIAGGELKQAVTTVSALRSADAAEVLGSLSTEDAAEVIVQIEPEIAARVLLEMDENHQVEIAGRLRTGELHDLLERMPVDEAVDLLGDIPEDKKKTLLRLFGREEAGELEELLAYGDESAGGLMTTDYLAVLPRATAEEVIEQLRAASPDVETIYYVYVVSEEGRLEGVLSLRELIVAPTERRVEEIMLKDVKSVKPGDDQEEVARLIERYDLLALPVTGDDGRMLGIVTVDDVLDVMGDEAEEDIMRFAGATGIEEDMPRGLWANLGRRLPWFIVAAVIEILVAGGILKLYSPVMEQFVVLVFFIPLLVTMGGNIAVQSSTVMARRLMSGTPLERSTLKTVLREVFWGVAVGAVTGTVVAAFSRILNLGASVGLVVGLSLAVTILVAALVGCALPIAFKALNKDPGVVSGPFLGTTMDVLSLAIYLGVGRLLI